MSMGGVDWKAETPDGQAPSGTTSVTTVGVIGAGVMGRGVCTACARAGFRVVLVDVSDAILDAARARLREEVRAATLLLRGPAFTYADVLARTTFTRSLGDLVQADIVVENATEKWEVKRPIYEQIDDVCRPGVVVGINTSALPITRLAALTRRPSDVVGMHFMNPVPLKPTVELIRGHHTSERALGSAEAFLRCLGKDCIVVNDSPGFVTNRVMMLTINEAVFLLHEHVASAADIDRLFLKCFGHAMGPLQTADLIGLDTVLLSLEVLYDEFKDSKYRPCPLLQRMVDAGLHGRKTDRGFFTYTA